MTIKAVIFDIGNVFLHWDPEGYYDRRIGQARRKSLFAEVPLHEMNVAVDLGAPFGDSVVALATEHVAWHDEILLWRDCWLEMARPGIPGSAALLRVLKARGMPVHALSNFGNGTFEIAEAAYPVLTEFDRRYISGQMGLIKPDPAIYRAVEQDLGLAGDTIFFTDDRHENIAAAEARGWQGYVFDDPEGLARRLVAEGLLGTAEAGLEVGR